HQVAQAFGPDPRIKTHVGDELVFFVILPVLIFEAAWNLDLGLLRRWLLPILLLSTAGMLICAFVAAALIYIGIGHSSFPWVAALLTGAILAATDPAAVIAQLREANAPAELATLFEGESLFNDATAVVLFSLVLTVALNPEVMRGNAFGLFAAVFLGGSALGLVAGLLASILLLLVGRPSNTTILLLFTAFGSFFVAEHVFNASGIMAVVVAAIVVRSFLKEVENTVAGGLSHTWTWSGELLNSVLFVIMGLTITLGMFTSHWLAMLIAIVAALIGRVAGITSCGALTQLTRRKIPLRWQFVITWGGLRGVIALALALALPTELGYWYTVQSMVFGVVLFSLLVQGTTSQMLIRRWAPERRRRPREEPAPATNDALEH
ncbi:MAG: sodium:proton antiporter, partial [Pseudomonadota bacterium]